ncbi:glycosyl hydrolase family 61-domain-containing protein [Ephemerocybe angulata]|uniref:AA9 family lytic polysaccharide monooxygenase n=1 Tax=Ephemerocybe angulata TaxID=980116 RepID=A0A8H6I0F9_9AGAR|nr:glycosyl hydrolase family 61-domain-containing protein [Tulosesus angulatus]
MRTSIALLATLFVLFQTVSAHYIFETLIFGEQTSKKAVRRPSDNTPVYNVTSNEIRCNVDLKNATETPTVEAGALIGFHLDEPKTIYHMGPLSMYLGQAPGKAAAWDGSGKAWFKIAHWGAVFRPKFTFLSLNQKEFTTTIPKSVPSGEYLIRIEHIGLHLTGAPEFFISCAQIKIVNGGKGNPPKVSIPGYLKPNDPSLMVNIWWPVPTSYQVPGPKPYRGQPDICNIKNVSKSP